MEGHPETYSNQLVGVVHHGDEHVEQHHQGNDVVRAKHGGPDVLGELVAGLDVGDVQVDQPEYGPEERLKRLKQPENKIRKRQQSVSGKKEELFIDQTPKRRE